jgi:hypothetical protein
MKILRLETEAVDLAWRTAIGFGCDYDGEQLHFSLSYFLTSQPTPTRLDIKKSRSTNGFPTDTLNLEPTIQHHHPNPASHRHPRFPRFHLTCILLNLPRLLAASPMVQTHRSDLHGLTRLTIRSILTDPKEPLLFPCQLPHLRSPHPRFLSPLPP